jgi:tRNA A37 N6-isopentenylltransferase MiaA
MQLLVLILLAVVVGYFLAKSQFSKKIDETSEKVSQNTRDLADRSEKWVRSKFGKQDVADAEASTLSDEDEIGEMKTAKKRPSRRVKEAEEETKSEVIEE